MKIDTILFDMGGTLEEIWYSSDVASVLPGRIEEILKIGFKSFTDEDGEAFFRRLQDNYAEYRSFREKTFIEVHPAMVWRDWILKDYEIPDQTIFDNHEALACLWETEVIKRKCREGVGEMLEALKQRDLHLGIISNTGSFTQVYKSLEQYGVWHYFEKIALSSDYGIRKPHAFLFHDVLRQMKSEPSRSVYVGDTVSRDVVGAKKAGLFKTIQIKSEFTRINDTGAEGQPRPDYVIHDLMSIPGIIEEINQK